MSLYLKPQKRFLKKFLVALSLIACGTLVYAILCLAAVIFRFPPIAHPVSMILLMSLLSVLIYKPIDILFTKLFKHYLFRQKSMGYATLMQLAHELQSHLQLSELAHMLVNSLGEILDLKTVGLLAGMEDQSRFDIAAAFGWKVSDIKQTTLPKTAPVIDYIKMQGAKVIVRDELLRALPFDEATRISYDFNILQSNWVVPLWVKGHLIGVLAFASVNPEKKLESHDFKFFKEFAASISIAVYNALRFEQMQKMIRELQDTQSKLIQQTRRAAIEQLATGIAHEIHNPLTIISGKAQVMLLKKDKDQPLPEPVEDVLKIIVQQTKRAADITRKLLMFSQGAIAKKEPLDLVQILKDTLALVSYQRLTDGIEIVCEPHSKIPLFYGNIHEIREVFLGLILNAVQAIANPPGKITCEIHYAARENSIEIWISDTGVGISKEQQELIFNPFYTSRKDGLGLGLFVTQQIIHRYGGTIRIESRMGEGSLFLIQLPLQDESQTRDAILEKEPERQNNHEGFNLAGAQ